MRADYHGHWTGSIHPGGLKFLLNEYLKAKSSYFLILRITKSFQSQAMLEKTGVSLGEVDQVRTIKNPSRIYSSEFFLDRNQRSLCCTSTLLPEGFGHPHGEVQHMWRCCYTGPFPLLTCSITLNTTNYNNFRCCCTGPPPRRLWIQDLSPPRPQAEEERGEIWHWLCMYRRWPGNRDPLRESLKLRKLIPAERCALKRVPPTSIVYYFYQNKPLIDSLYFS